MEAHDPARLTAARERVLDLAATHRIAVIMPMDWDSPEGTEAASRIYARRFAPETYR